MNDIKEISDGLCDAIGLIHAWVPKSRWGNAEQAIREALEMVEKKIKSESYWMNKCAECPETDRGYNCQLCRMR